SSDVCCSDLPAPAAFGSAHLAELPRLDGVDEATHAVGARDEWAVLDALDRVADVLVDVRERARLPLGPLAGLLLELVRELLIVDRQHPAVGVMDQHDLL